MPTTPYIPTLPAYMADAIADSSIFRVTPSSYSPLLPEPIQPLRDIRSSGFDGIIQMTDAVMMASLSRSLRRSLTVNALISSDRISSDIESRALDEVRDYVAAERIEADIEPYELRVSLSVSGVNVSHGASPTASVHFSVALSVLAGETYESWHARTGLGSFRNLPPHMRDFRPPTDSTPLTAEISIGSVTLDISGPVRTQIDESRFWVRTYIDFASADIDSVGSSSWEPLVMSLVTPLIRGWGDSALAPDIRLFGGTSSPIREATRFDVTVLGLPSNQLGSLLSFCIETAPGSAAPDTAMVGAFTGNGNFAFFATSPLIYGTLLSQWRTLPQRELEAIVPMVIERDGTNREASARIRYELGDAHWAELSYGTEHMSDNILISATFRSQTLSARLEGSDISGELGNLANPRETREYFRVFADHSPVEQPNEGIENWLLAAGRHLLPPLLRPVGSGWRLQADYETQVSAPLSAMVTRGLLR